MTDVDEAAGNGAVAAVRDAGGDATFVRANVAEWSDCQAMVATAVDTYGALHVLYNNAGIFPADDGGVLDTPAGDVAARDGRQPRRRVARLQGRRSPRCSSRAAARS